MRQIGTYTIKGNSAITIVPGPTSRDKRIHHSIVIRSMGAPKRVFSTGTPAYVIKALS